MRARALTRRPIISMVTGRCRLPGIASDRAAALPGLVAEAVEAGVDLIQVREPDLADAALLDLVVGCVDAARRSNSAILVNDRLDVALAAGADGVHLRGCSVPASSVRQHVPDRFLVGRAVHDIEEALRVAGQGGLDYLQLGTVYPSRSKPGGPTCGVEPVEAVTRVVRTPLLAIGGIAVGNCMEVFRAGAAGVASIGLFVEAGAISQIVEAIRRSYRRSHVERQ